MFVLLGCGRVEHRHDARVFEIARRDAFEMRADAAQFGSHKTVHKMQAPIQPRKQLVLDLVVDRKRDLGAVWPNLSKINNTRQGDVPAYGFERVLIWRVALDRQKDCVSLKP